MFLPSTHSFLLVQKEDIKPDSSLFTDSEMTFRFTNTEKMNVGMKILIPNIHSFLYVSTRSVDSDISYLTENVVVETPQKEVITFSEGSETKVVNDSNKRTFLKAAGIAGAGLVVSQLLPKQAEALVLGSSPTTGVVGIKNSSNVRINPATEETLSTLLKTSDLTFDAGSLQVKITSVSGDGSSSFSNSENVAKSGLVDADRHVQVDVLSSALPTSASTEATLQTISFGGFKFTVRLATVSDIDYVGEAAIGTSTSAPSWRIRRIDTSNGVVIQWAGTGVFDQIWDNRASLNYS